MADVVGAKTCHASTGATADQYYLTQQVRQVSIRNTHASQYASVRVFTGATAAAALAAATATPAVALADETYTVPAGQREVVFKSTRAKFVALSIICSGATTPISVHGTDFFD